MGGTFGIVLVEVMLRDLKRNAQKIERLNKRILELEEIVRKQSAIIEGHWDQTSYGGK
jgi:hypothetical protein